MVDLEKILFAMRMDVNAFFWYFYDYGLALLFVFIFVELIKLAFDLASGRPANWDSKLVTLLLIGVLGVNWGRVDHLFWNFAIDLAKLVYAEFPDISDIFKNKLGLSEDASVLSIIGDILSDGITGIVNVIVAAFATLILVIIFIIIDVYIIATFFCYCLLLSSGLCFFPFLLSSDFKNIALQWFNNVFVFFNVIISDNSAGFIRDFIEPSAAPPGSIKPGSEKLAENTDDRTGSRNLNCSYKVRKKKGKSFFIDKVCDNKVITYIYLPLNMNRPAIFYAGKKKAKKLIPCIYYDKGDFIEIHRVLDFDEVFVLKNGKHNVTHIYRRKKR